MKRQGLLVLLLGFGRCASQNHRCDINNALQGLCSRQLRAGSSTFQRERPLALPSPIRRHLKVSLLRGLLPGNPGLILECGADLTYLQEHYPHSE